MSRAPETEHPEADEAPRFVTVAQAARLLGISKNSAYDMIARGTLPALRVGRRDGGLRVPRAAIDRLEAQTLQETPQ